MKNLLSIISLLITVGTTAHAWTIEVPPNCRMVQSNSPVGKKQNLVAKLISLNNDYAKVRKDLAALEIEIQAAKAALADAEQELDPEIVSVPPADCVAY